jgi:PPM family protein phosphatase
MHRQDSRAFVKIVAMTDIGLARCRNEDAFGVYSEKRSMFSTQTNQVQIEHLPHAGTLMLVSDGMGGANAGEVASRMVVEGMIRSFQESQPVCEVIHPSQRLVKAVETVNLEVLEAAVGAQAGMGATLSALFLHGSVGYFAQVGDSRIYLIRNGRVTQLTKDQTVVQRLVDHGVISAEKAATHPQRNILTQAIGTSRVILPALGAIRFASGDRVVLCTDGLSGKIDSSEYLQVLEETLEDTEMAAQRLVSRSNERGGEDNITLVIAEIGTGTAEPSEIPRVLPFTPDGIGYFEVPSLAAARIGQ